MSQIKTKFIENLAVSTAKIAAGAVDSTKLAADAVTAASILADSITGAKIRLANDEALRARNFLGDGDINILKVNASNEIELSLWTLPSADGSAGQVLSTDGFGITSWATLPAAGITELTGDVTAGPGSGAQAATISANAVDGSKFRLNYQEWLRARNQLNTADIDILRLSGNSVHLQSPDIIAIETPNSSIQLDAQIQFFVDELVLASWNGGPINIKLLSGDFLNYIAINPPAVGVADYTLTLPAAAPAADQILKSDASGNLSWTAAGGSGSSSQVIGGGDITASALAPDDIKIAFTESFYVEIPELAYADNPIEIDQSPIEFPVNLQAAYIIPDGLGSSLPVTVSNLASVPSNAVILARRDDVPSYSATDEDFIQSASDSAKFNSLIYSTARQSDGKLLIAGNFTNYNGVTDRNYLIRLNSDGTLDTTFCTNAVDGAKFAGDIQKVSVQADGKILVGGNFLNYAGTSGRNRLVRLNSDGTLDTTFCTNAVDGSKFGNVIYEATEQSDNKILVAGRFTNYAGTTGRDRLVRLNSDGTLDTTFCTNASDGAKFTGGALPFRMRVVEQADNKLVVAGAFINYAGTTDRSRLIRLNSDGTLDTAFCNNASDGAKFGNTLIDARVQADGKILVAGGFQNYAGTTGRDRLVRLNSDGTLDTTFCTNASDGAKFTGGVNAVNIQSDNKVLVGGTFGGYDGILGRSFLIRLNSDGTLDTQTDFLELAVDGGKFNSAIQAITVEPDDELIVGGSFFNYGGVVDRNFLVKLGRYTTFSPSVVMGSGDRFNIGDRKKLYQDRENLALINTKADRTLSNLTAPTSVNEDLLMQADKTLGLPNNTYLKALNSAGDTYIDIVKLDNGNRISLSNGKVYVDPASSGSISITGSVSLYHNTDVELYADNIYLGGNNTSPVLKFYTLDYNNTISITVPAVGVTDYTLTLPAAAPTANQILKSDASGNLSWAADAAGGTWSRESFTLLAGDITNGYVTLANTPISASIIMVVSGLVSVFGTDYTMTGAQLNFSGHTPALIAGDVVIVQYQY